MAIIFLFTCFFIQENIAQTRFESAVNDSLSAFQLPIGYTRIGGQDFFGFRIQPQFKLGKLGIGINIPVLFKVNRDDSENNLRNEEFGNGTGSLRLLTYIRYGMQNKDKLYFRTGALDQLRLGQGLLINNYSNETSFERRKVGILFDVRPIEQFGVEGFYSDFNGFNNLLSLRPYFRPFTKSKNNVFSSVELSGSWVRDADNNRFDETGQRQDTRIVGAGFNAYALDASAKIIKSELLELTVSAQYASLGKSNALQDSITSFIAANPDAQGSIIERYGAGTGFSIGADAIVGILDKKLSVEMRLERLFYSEHFLPQFFDIIYEIDKDAKLWRLGSAPQVQGTYGSLTATISEKFNVTASLRIPDQVTDASPALVQFGTSAKDFPIKGLTFYGNYVKGNLGNLADAFTLDERALLTAGFRYELLGIFMIGTNYLWTFARVTEDGIDDFKATRYVTPYFGLYISFDKEKKNKK